MSANLIWMNGFTAYQGGGGKGGGKGGLFGGGGQKETDYRADIILALCEGPIQGTNFIWKDQSLVNATVMNMLIFGGDQNQEMWSWLTFFYPAQQVTYSGTAYAAAAWYQMGRRRPSATSPSRSTATSPARARTASTPIRHR